MDLISKRKQFYHNYLPTHHSQYFRNGSRKSRRWKYFGYGFILGLFTALLVFIYFS